MSLGFGALKAIDPEHLFMGNPVWQRPLIRIADGVYFCPVPGMMLSFPLEIVETLLGDSEALTRGYEKRRAVFLEQETARLLDVAFPARSAGPLRLAGATADAEGGSGDDDARVARRANVKPGVHILHTFCLHLAMRGAPARAIGELAAHQDLDTTQRNMHLSPAALDAAIRLLETGTESRGEILEAAGNRP
jgi:integrase